MNEENNLPVGRDADGRWLKGYAPNPTGIGGNQKGFVPWAVRVEQLQMKYDTGRKLFALFIIDEEKGTAKASDELLDMNPIDIGIIWQMFGAVYGNDKRLERESLWNRKEGLPKETVKHEGGIAHGLDPRLLAIIRDVRRAKSDSGEETTRMVEHGAAKPDSAAG